MPNRLSFFAVIHILKLFIFYLKNTQVQLIRIQPSPDQSLSASDQVAVTNIFHAYENTCILTRNTRFPNFPTIGHTSTASLLNEMSPIIETYIEYFKLIPEFNNLMIDDRLRLAKNNFGTMININERLLYPLITTNCITTWFNTFTSNIIEHIFKRNRMIDEFLCDPIILKILLVIVTLSSGNNRNTNEVNLDIICDDSLSIFAAQNIYVELLWRYILTRSSTRKDAVKSFNNIVMLILHIQKINMYVDEHFGRNKLPNKEAQPVIQSLWPSIEDQEKNVETTFT